MVLQGDLGGCSGRPRRTLAQERPYSHHGIRHAHRTVFSAFARRHKVFLFLLLSFQEPRTENRSSSGSS